MELAYGEGSSGTQPSPFTLHVSIIRQFVCNGVFEAIEFVHIVKTLPIVEDGGIQSDLKLKRGYTSKTTDLGALN